MKIKNRREGYPRKKSVQNKKLCKIRMEVNMSFPVSAALLDAMVLAVVANEETYGYKITQELCDAVSVSESTLYPVLRRLQKGGMLDTYDKAYQGRNRRYYKITDQGKNALTDYRNDWQIYRNNIEKILINGGVING